MNFIEQEISGVFLIEPEPFSDDRGLFRRHFCSREFKENSIENSILQCNISENKNAFTLRGFHYQREPDQEAKTLSCIVGSIYNIVVDIRENSKTFKKWISFELSDSNRTSLHVPPGCANAFLTLKDNTHVHYYISKNYAPNSESGIRFDDPAFNFRWPASPKFISQKDLNHPAFRIK